MKKILFLFLAWQGYATMSLPFTMDVGEGYREDKLKIHLHLPGDPSTLVYEEDYEHMRFAQTEVTLRTVQRDIFMLLNVGYGAIGRGDLKAGPSPQIHCKTEAQAYNALGLLGYQTNLTPQRHYTVAITPLFGYAWYYENIERKDPSLSHDLHMQWKGFFLGVDLQIQPGGKATFNATYAYHFMGLKERMEGPMTTIRVNVGGNHGHLGILKAAYPFSKHWSGILYSKILYLTSHERDVIVKQQVTSETFLLPRKLKLRYTTFELLLELSYQF